MTQTEPVSQLVTAVTVVQFDAELLVHQAALPVGCGSGVLVTIPLGYWENPAVGRRRVVERCHLARGHQGAHTADDATGQTHRAVRTACGLSMTDGAWIEWTPSDDDPRCPSCFDLAADEQETLL